MKLKALLLGSAAAMMAVAGASTAANAADAVVAEPEPVEYVRVCDQYGARWFFMPGTETCIQFDGYVRVTYVYNSPDNGRSSANFGTRARLNVRTRNETDYGTLEGFIRFQAGGPGVQVNDNNAAVDRALISLGGFRLGYSDAFQTTHHGYGLYNDIQDGYYDYHQATFFDYTYAANGFSATLGLQLSAGGCQFGCVNARGLPGAIDPIFDARELDYYAGLSYSGSIGGIAGSVVWDNETDEANWKISGDLNIIDGLNLRAWYQNDSGDTKYTTGAFGPFNTRDTRVDEEWGVGMQYTFSDQLRFRAGYTAAYGQPAATGGDTEYFIVGLDFRPVDGLIIRPEATFAEEGEQYSIRVYRTF